MKKTLAIKAVIKLLSGLVLVGVLLFLPAGTMNYPGAWLFIALLFIPMLIVGVVMLKKSPKLLEKRLKTDETEPEQKTVILLSSLMFIGGFLLCGFDYRFAWSKLPMAVSVIAGVLLLIGYALYVESMRENAYISRTVELQEGQKLMDTGLYGIVRHPMYLATVLIFLSIPLILGSIYGFIVFLIYPLILVKRIKNEEQLLCKGLEGYAEYMNRVKYRILPFVW